MKKGLFISFEGLDGSGKTTQIQMLKEHLNKENYPVIITKEPGGTLIGEKIRNLLLNPENNNPPVPLAEIFLFMADRAKNTSKNLRPALKTGSIVITDRYIICKIYLSKNF